MASPDTISTSLPALAPKPTDEPEKPVQAESSKRVRAKEKDEDGIGIEELSMPRTMIQKLAKASLPQGTNLQKDALLALSKSATLFINHLAGAAQEHINTFTPAKKTIQPVNIFGGLKEIEFAWMIEHLEAELQKYIDIQSSKREEYKKKIKEGKAAPDGSTILVGDEDSLADGIIQTRGADPGAQLEAESAIDRQRTAKRTKGIGGEALAAGDGDDDEDVDMGEAEAADEIEEEEEEEADEDATEDEAVADREGLDEDRIGTEPEDEGEENEAGSEDDSD